MGLQQGVDLGRTDDGAVAGEDLVVGLDAVVVIKIVDHEAEGFPDPTNSCVAEPVDALEPRAVPRWNRATGSMRLPPDADRVR